MDHGDQAPDAPPVDRVDPPVEPALTPVQQEVLHELGASTVERPRFDPDLGRHLRSALENGLAPVLESLDQDAGEHVAVDRNNRVFVGKYPLAKVLGCEGLYLATDAEPFTWSVPTATGTIVHKAIELGIAWDGDAPPRVLVDAALERLSLDTAPVSDWLYSLDEPDRAQLRADAVALVSAFDEVFPPLKAQWRPVTETKLRAELAKGAVVLSGRVDLTLGRAHGDLAGKVIIDFKTGNQRPDHVEDLRFYALLETLARGVPPRLVASAYLDSGRLRTEVVTTDLLEAAVRRTIEGVTRIIELTRAGRPPRLLAAGHCRWCPALDACATGRSWIAETDADEGDRYDPDDV
jgi:CRISPR/Cas system-associated exonuclease Cas4 (RecB family)